MLMLLFRHWNNAGRRASEKHNNATRTVEKCSADLAEMEKKLQSFKVHHTAAMHMGHPFLTRSSSVMLER